MWQRPCHVQRTVPRDQIIRHRPLCSEPRTLSAAFDAEVDGFRSALGAGVCAQFTFKEARCACVCRSVFFPRKMSPILNAPAKVAHHTHVAACLRGRSYLGVSVLVFKVYAAPEVLTGRYSSSVSTNSVWRSGRTRVQRRKAPSQSVIHAEGWEC